MDEAYDYLDLRFPRDAMPGLRAVLADRAREAIAEAGAIWVGAWLGAGGIGWFDDEAVVLVAWPDRRDDATGWIQTLITGAECVAIPLVATARPEKPRPVRTGGVHAHRWFDVEPGHENEVVDLSAAAWPAFEGNFEAHIEGLFRAEDGSDRMLLVTWYSSVAEWERSRAVGAADHGALGEARRNFQRRRQLTRRQVVRLAGVVP